MSDTPKPYTVQPAFPRYGIGAGPGIGRLLIGSPPIPSIFAETAEEVESEGGIGGFQIGGSGIGGGSDLTPFSKAIADLRKDRLMLVSGLIGRRVQLTDDYILENLLAAERDTEHELRVYITPRQIVPVGTPIETVRQLMTLGVPMVEEPGYPYDSRIFNGMDLETRHRPIIDITRLWYAYQGEPSKDLSVQPLYDVPLDWLQVDRKYGKINLLPTATFTDLPLNTWLLSVLGSGRDIPFGLKLLYTAGLTNVKVEWPDLLVLIKRKAVLSILNDRFIASSGSISADGLSQNLSRDMAKYEEQIERGMKKLQSAIKGVRFAVF